MLTALQLSTRTLVPVRYSHLRETSEGSSCYAGFVTAGLGSGCDGR